VSSNINNIETSFDLSNFLYIESKQTGLIPELEKIEAKGPFLIPEIIKIELKRTLLFQKI
jgi:hypothetical protein